MYTANAEVVGMVEALQSVAESIVFERETEALREHAFAVIAAWHPVQSADKRVMRLRSKYLADAQSILQSL